MIKIVILLYAPLKLLKKALRLAQEPKDEMPMACGK